MQRTTQAAVRKLSESVENRLQLLGLHLQLLRYVLDQPSRRRPGSGSRNAGPRAPSPPTANPPEVWAGAAGASARRRAAPPVGGHLLRAPGRLCSL